MQTDVQTPVAPLPAPALGRWANANELPVIDFAPLGGRNAEAIDQIAREVHDACRDIGFLTIVNHPVPPAKIKEIFRQSARFFALPLADKMKAYMGNSNLFRGYLPMDEPGKQKAYRGKAIEGFQPHLDPARMKAASRTRTRRSRSRWSWRTTTPTWSRASRCTAPTSGRRICRASAKPSSTITRR
jgi:isopenicillin N synthase-like dioxygenase